MRCLNLKHGMYCYCEFVVENKECPLIELKRLIDKYKSTDGIDMKGFINAIIAINIIELVDKIKTDTPTFNDPKERRKKG